MVGLAAADLIFILEGGGGFRRTNPEGHDIQKYRLDKGRIGMADEGGDPNRPSFSDFWKKSKDAWGGKRIRFVDGTPAQAQAQGAAAGGAGEGSSGES